MLVVLGVFVALAVVVYRACLEGGFVSDDHGYLTTNAWVQQPSWEHLLAILDPHGEPAAYIANWSPLHLLLHSLAWQAFGADPLGHHVVNIVVHALASTLLVVLLERSGVPRWLARFGGALFLLHPANVEAVAWISQLKSTAALALALGAVLVQSRRPGPGLLLFVAALLVKPTAAFALPLLAGLLWAQRAAPRQWLWLAAWALGLLAVIAPELTAFGRGGEHLASAPPDLAAQLRFQIALGMRYLVMAATGSGLSTFHEPASVDTWRDPWFLAGLAVGGLLAWRTLATLRAREQEAAFWLAAAAGFVPVSQTFSFLYPMADRYLYFILPGLIGGILLAGGKLVRPLRPEPIGAGRASGARALWRVALPASASLLLLFFAVRSAARAEVFTSDARMLIDAARSYPDGLNARLLDLDRAARGGDLDDVLAALAALRERGYLRFWELARQEALEPYRNEPRYREEIAELAGAWLVAAEALAAPTQSELHVMAMAYMARGQRERAIETLRRAKAAGGPRTAQIAAEIAALQRGEVLWGLPPRAQPNAARAEGLP